MKTLIKASWVAALVVVIQSCGDGRPANDGVKDPAHDQLNNSQDLLNESNLGDDDHRFMNEAALGGIYELNLSRYVAEHASAKQVKETAAQIAADHQQINDELKQLAETKNVLLPSKLSNEKQQQLDAMMKMQGSSLDNAYLAEMKKLHQKDIETFKQAATSARNVNVQKFAEAKLPVLEGHLRMIEKQ